MIFNREKISIKSDKTKDGLKYYIDYGRLDDNKNFIAKLISSIFQDKLVLGVVDTSLFYSSQKVNNEEFAANLKELCGEYSIENKIIKTKKDDVGIFGAKIKIGDKVKEFDYIFGLILDGDMPEKVSDIFCKYNSSIYAVNNKDILETFDFNYMDTKFNLSTFNDNFMRRMVVSTKEDNGIKAILDKVKEEFK
jgi:hypothetical protein